MKILAFSDLHCDQDFTETVISASFDADVVISAGDLSTKKDLPSRLIDLFSEIQVPTLLVPGNHDDPAELSMLCNRLDNFYFLHGKKITLENIDFFGLGFEIPQRDLSAWNEHLSEEDASDLLIGCPEKSVLITHTPPFGLSDMQSNGKHEGSKSVLDAVETKSPLICFCGHIHHSWGVETKIGSTLVMNLGPRLNWIEI